MRSFTSSSDSDLAENRSARRALLALFGAFVAMNALAIGVWLVMPFSAVSEERYLAAADDHIAMLERSKGEEGRIVLLGGSGVAFSISAESLGKELGRPVYNGGIQAGIGFRNLVDMYAAQLDPENDLIVLVPEPELLANDARYSQVWCDVVFLRKALDDLAREPRCLPHVIHRTYQDIRHHITGASASDPVYRRSGFNAVGDLTSHLGLDRSARDLAEYRAPAITAAALARFEDYVTANLIERGFDVMYIPAAMPDAECAANRDRLARMVTRLSRLSTIKHPPHDLNRYCLAHNLFFDGAAHLNRDGRVIQTGNVRRSLADALADNVAVPGAN